MNTEASPTRALPSPPNPAETKRQARILAKTVYRELRSSGLEERDVMAIATELLALVTEELRSRA